MNFEEQRSIARARARKLAEAAIARGEPLAWFHEVYELAEDSIADIPWAENEANPHLTGWMRFGPASQTPPDLRGVRTLVVGCGVGDDAHALAAAGARVSAFDLSPMAIDWCRRRFANEPIDFSVADLFALPANWKRAFELVVEVYTLQSLHVTIRAAALEAIADCVAPGGTLLVVARGRDPGEGPGRMPWPLTREEIVDALADAFDETGFEDFFDAEDPPVRRFRFELTRR